MNKIQKFLNKLDDQKRDFVLELMRKIKSNNLRGLNVKKLEGNTLIYRLKKGDFLIIFEKNGKDTIIILVIRRSEKTYRDF